MKKIFTFAALLCAAVTMNAEITAMTCAEAKEAALQLNSGATGTDSVAVTGYVTYTNGTLSRGQQTFWLDDEKGTTQTFQAYWCNIPSGEDALNVGDKVTIRGFLMNYNGTTAEMKNGDTQILERVVIKRDTMEATICEVIEEGEALNAMEITNDFFIVEGIVSSVATPLNQYKQETFSLTCDQNSKELKVYNILMKDSVEAFIGDKVSVFGKIQNYNGTIEIISGTAEVLEKGNVKIDTISVSVAQAVAAGKALENGKTSVEVYIVEGYCDSIAYNFSETTKNMSFYMCDDLANPSYEFEAYKASTEVDIPVGTKVQIVGNLYHYYKAATDDKPEIDLVEISNGKAIVVAEQGIDKITSSEKALKRIEAGQVVIIRNGVRYNALGIEVK